MNLTHPSKVFFFVPPTFCSVVNEQNKGAESGSLTLPHMITDYVALCYAYSWNLSIVLKCCVLSYSNSVAGLTVTARGLFEKCVVIANINSPYQFFSQKKGEQGNKTTRVSRSP